ncbi:uncharacterized protein LOC124817183 [Hydra vulgaris]|uniref:uncharacterized protein LOC124817183 n=1 Tax=Hydra vulgaris TaxID=6087 RepID=UPI001F5F0E62|nr:uncharacterized protein LOC124817183 [Hydra vulgaris]
MVKVNTSKEKKYKKNYVLKKAPKRTIKQKEVARTKCYQLTKLFRKKQVIVDDEFYFDLSNFELSENSGYYSSDRDNTSNEVKHKRVQKFEPKLLVWVALSPKGRSKHFIVPSGQAINKDVYLDKCLRSRLIPFIEQYHKNNNVIFWPDLASSHYSKKVQAFLNSKNIEFVPKERIIANTPELKPIEDFWSEIKQTVYTKCWQAENLEQLRNRIDYCFKNLDPNIVQRFGRLSFTQVDAARQNGIQNL